MGDRTGLTRPLYSTLNQSVVVGRNGLLVFGVEGEGRQTNKRLSYAVTAGGVDG
jgi:hypothetical protein